MKFTLPPSAYLPSSSSAATPLPAPSTRSSKLKRKPKPLSPVSGLSGFDIPRPKSSPSAFTESPLNATHSDASPRSLLPRSVSRELTPLPMLPPSAPRNSQPAPLAPTPRLASLTISPDLDALLAHDELIRKRQSQVRSGSSGTPPPPRSPQTPRSQISSVGSLSPGTPWNGSTHTLKTYAHSPVLGSWGAGRVDEESREPVLQSLPAPPPKRRTVGRRATIGGDEKRSSVRNSTFQPPPPSPTSTMESRRESFSLSEMDNPYINPAPSVEDVQRMRMGTLSESLTTTRQTDNHASTQHHTAHRGSHLSAVGDHAATENYKSEQLPLSFTFNTSKSKSRGRLFKEKKKDGKNINVSKTSDTEVRVQTTGKLESSATSRIYPQEYSSHSRQHTNNEEMDTTSNGKPWRRAPQPGSELADSHASTHSHSKSTTLSEFYFVDEDPYSPPPGSTFSPAFSAEDAARISISSTIYPPSDHLDLDLDEDDPYDLYNEQDFEVIPTPRTHSFNISSPRDRVSFIELTSPTFAPEEGGYSNMSFRDRSPNGSIGSSFKPPIPTTPKPDFTITAPQLKSSSRKSKSKKFYPEESPAMGGELPPTTNYLAAEDRADLIRKSRKLTRVFGQTPRGTLVSPGPHSSSVVDTSSGQSFLDISPTRHRSAFSIASSVVDVRPNLQHQSSTYNYTTPPLASSSSLAEKRLGHSKPIPKSVWPPPASGTQYLTAAGRRHSTPLTPDEFDFLNDLHHRDPISTIGNTKSASDREPDDAVASDGYEVETEEDGGDLIEIGTQEGEARVSTTSLGQDIYTYGPVTQASDSRSSSKANSRRGSTKVAPVLSPSVMSFMDLSDGEESVPANNGKASGSGGRRRGDDENSDVVRIKESSMTGSNPDSGSSVRTGAPIVSIGVSANTHPTELIELESQLSHSPIKIRNRKMSDSSSSVNSGRTSSSSLSSIAFAPTSANPNSLGFAPNAHSGSGSRLPAVPSNFDFYSSSTPSLHHQYSIDSLFEESALPPTSLPGPSLYRSLSLLSLTPEELADEEKRRKREKLAKLHRFLGSRVPANLVLGLSADNLGFVLPPEMDVSPSASGSGDEGGKKAWLRRRRSSSSAALGAGWSDAIDRVKDDLGDEERMVNVRRAVKMEKVFGVAPPPTLYHTRGHAPSASVSVANLHASNKTSSSLGFVAPKLLSSSSADDYLSPNKFAPNPGMPGSGSKSSSSKPKKPKNSSRPSTADSTKELLPKGDLTSTGSAEARKGQEGVVRRARGASLVYTHYQHSLNSLNDILDRDDRESLAELHDYLNNTDLDVNLDFGLGVLDLNNVDVDLAQLSPAAPLPSTNVTGRDRAMSNVSIRSERRRSLPARTSLISISSQSVHSSDLDVSTPITGTGIPSPDARRAEFQTRRRRAAKLTQFFGVNYRDLIRDVLESIENGLEHERRRGTIGAEEAEDLLQKLRTLRTKRDGLV